MSATNLSANSMPGLPAANGSVIWSEGYADDTELGPWTVRWSIGLSKGIK